MRKNLRNVLVAGSVVLVAIALGFAIYSSWSRSHETGEPIELLQWQAYKHAVAECEKSTQAIDCRNDLLIQSVASNGVPGEWSDGYIFTLSNTRRPSDKSIVYRVTVSDRGVVEELQRVASAHLDSFPY